MFSTYLSLKLITSGRIIISFVTKFQKEILTGLSTCGYCKDCVYQRIFTTPDTHSVQVGLEDLIWKLKGQGHVVIFSWTHKSCHMKHIIPDIVELSCHSNRVGYRQYCMGFLIRVWFLFRKNFSQQCTLMQQIRRIRLLCFLGDCAFLMIRHTQIDNLWWNLYVTSDQL